MGYMVVVQGLQYIGVFTYVWELNKYRSFIGIIEKLLSTGYAEDIRSIPSRGSSSDQHFARDKHEEAAPSDRHLGKTRHKTVDSSTSVTPTATSDDERARRNESRTSIYERPSRKADRQNIDGPVAIPSSVANVKSISPVSMVPMWLSAKNREMSKLKKTSSSVSRFCLLEF